MGEGAGRVKKWTGEEIQRWALRWNPPKEARLENRMDLPRVPNGKEDSNDDAKVWLLMIKGGLQPPQGRNLRMIDGGVMLAKVYGSTGQINRGPGRPGPGVRPDRGRSVNSMYAKLRIQPRPPESWTEPRGLLAWSLSSPLASPCYFSYKRQIGKHNSGSWSC